MVAVVKKLTVTIVSTHGGTEKKQVKDAAEAAKSAAELIKKHGELHPGDTITVEEEEVDASQQPA